MNSTGWTLSERPDQTDADPSEDAVVSGEVVEPNSPPSTVRDYLNDIQRKSFLVTCNRLRPHPRNVRYDLESPGWSPEDTQQLGEKLEYECRFSKSKTNLRHCHTMPLELKPVTAPIAARFYGTDPVVFHPVDRELDSTLAAGLIKHSTSPSLSPPVCVPKKDNTIRIAVDCKRLNATRIENKRPLPGKDYVLDSLGKGRIHSTFDLMSVFFQKAVHPDSVELTTFLLSCAACTNGFEYHKVTPVPQALCHIEAVRYRWFRLSSHVFGRCDCVRPYAAPSRAIHEPSWADFRNRI